MILYHYWLLEKNQGLVVLKDIVSYMSLKFQTITEIRQYFFVLLKKYAKLLQSFSHFFSKKYWCIWL